MDNNVEKGKYKATRNLNTAIENPEMNVNGITTVNIQDISSNNNKNEDEKINLENLNISNNTIENNTNKIEPQNIIPETNDEEIAKEETKILSKFLNQSQKKISETEINDIKNYEENKKLTQYMPVLEEKKEDNKDSKIPSELLVLGLVVLILLIVVIVIPYIYDFIQNIILNMTT